jgi:hypothetical protein
VGNVLKGYDALMATKDAEARQDVPRETAPVADRQKYVIEFKLPSGRTATATTDRGNLDTFLAAADRDARLGGVA